MISATSAPCPGPGCKMQWEVVSHASSHSTADSRCIPSFCFLWQFLLPTCQGNASWESFPFAALPHYKFKIDFVIDTIITFPLFAWTLTFKYLQFLDFVLIFNTDIYSTCLLAFSKHDIAKWFSNCSSAPHPLALLLCSQEDCSNSLYSTCCKVVPLVQDTKM